MQHPGATAIGRNSHLRLLVGWGAVAAAVPYLVLKGLWLSGSTVGIADLAFFHTRTYVTANLLSFLLDTVAVAAALALTYPWGRRLPAWLVLVPMWVGTGLLGTIMVLLPVAAPFFRSAMASTAAEPLHDWVYLVIYAGFAAQGALLLTAFTFYVQDRWQSVLRDRDGALAAASSRAVQIAAIAASATGGVVAVLLLAWSIGLPWGLGHLAHQQTAVDRATLGVHGALALAASGGTLLIVTGRWTVRRTWLPLMLVWLGAGAMVTWGLFFLAYTAVDPTLTSPALTLATVAKVTAGSTEAATVVVLLRQGRRPQRRLPGSWKANAR